MAPYFFPLTYGPHNGPSSSVWKSVKSSHCFVQTLQWIPLSLKVKKKKSSYKGVAIQSHLIWLLLPVWPYLLALSHSSSSAFLTVPPTRQAHSWFRTSFDLAVAPAWNTFPSDILMDYALTHKYQRKRHLLRETNLDLKLPLPFSWTHFSCYLVFYFPIAPITFDLMLYIYYFYCLSLH